MSSIEAMNGIMASSNYIDVISNNIANASTVGFKSSTLSFCDMVSDSFYSTTQLGSGVGVSGINQNFNHGILMETGRDLDLGIEKDGFFRVLDEQGYVHYTRNGQFFLDKNKNIITAQGMYLTGQNQTDLKDSSNGVINLKPINLKNSDFLDAQATNKINLSANLSDYTIEKQSSYITIYDKNSNPYSINVSFEKDQNQNWKMYIESTKMDNNTTTDIIKKEFPLKFDKKGNLISEFSHLNLELKDFDELHIDLKCTIQNPQIDPSFIKISQNGYQKGDLKYFDILSNGDIIGKYTNEKEEKIGQIFLSKFINPERLKPESGGTWSATTQSGKEKIGTAGDDNFGVLITKSLESSNVDLNKELMHMIIAQRNYQSNAQAFKAEDKIINTLINLR